jgi:hypothetical protein
MNAASAMSGGGAITPAVSFDVVCVTAISSDNSRMPMKFAQIRQKRRKIKS